ncbi:MAG TPA: hypothetical protein VGS20_11160 [Candidatus Acidoferrales bacterium]|nr:hypothetical protein [Candidatus Acidoferrales bacterium]
MRRYWRKIGSLLTALVFLSMVGITGCAVRGTVRVYDPDYDDYHVWNQAEIVYYQRWEVETNHPDRDFRHRGREEQAEYWRWRHQHPDNDRDQH